MDLDHSDSAEPARHREAIEALAEELSRPLDEVKDAYESEFARLKQTAKVTDYLALFASRRAREALVGRQPGNPAEEKDEAANGARALPESASPRGRGSVRR